MPLNTPEFIELHDEDGIPHLVSIREIRFIASNLTSDSDDEEDGDQEQEEEDDSTTRTVVTFHDDETFEVIESYRTIRDQLVASQLAIRTKRS